MLITDNLIPNVLRIYSGHVQRSRLLTKSKHDDSLGSCENVTFSEDGKRRGLIEQVTIKALEQAEQGKQFRLFESSAYRMSGRQRKSDKTTIQLFFKFNFEVATNFRSARILLHTRIFLATCCAQ